MLLFSEVTAVTHSTFTHLTETVGSNQLDQFDFYSVIKIYSLHIQEAFNMFKSNLSLVQKKSCITWHIAITVCFHQKITEISTKIFIMFDRESLGYFLRLCVFCIFCVLH